jgi:sugar lactone lactonase YvrE
MIRIVRIFFVIWFALALSLPAAEEPNGELSKKLAGAAVEFYAEAPGYSEGPTWRSGELFFCSGGLLRVDAEKRVSKYLDIGPAGTSLRANGHLLICDNKSPALLDLAPDGKLGVVADQFEGKGLSSLNDVTVDKTGNIYWTDPAGSSSEKPVGQIFRVTPAGTVSKVAAGLAFPNGLDVDPAGEYLYVIESQSQKILRYPIPKDEQLLDKPTVFYDLGGSGGDGCTFDAGGNLWVADFHRKETGTGRIVVLSPAAKVLGYLNLPSKVVSNITFGGPEFDEVFCTTGEPPGVFRSKVGVRGFVGHPAPEVKILRYLDIKPTL